LNLVTVEERARLGRYLAAVEAADVLSRVSIKGAILGHFRTQVTEIFLNQTT
jgi:hypothetical protein